MGRPPERRIYIRAFRMMAEDLLRERFLRTEEPQPTIITACNDYLEKAEAQISRFEMSHTDPDVVT